MERTNMDAVPKTTYEGLDEKAIETIYNAMCGAWRRQGFENKAPTVAGCMKVLKDGEQVERALRERAGINPKAPYVSLVLLMADQVVGGFKDLNGRRISRKKAELRDLVYAFAVAAAHHEMQNAAGHLLERNAYCR